MVETMKQKLVEILDKEIVINNNILSEKEICIFENKFKIELPKEYKDFLTNYVEVYINDDYQFPMSEKSVFTPLSGFETMDFLYGGDFIVNAEQYISNYGKEMIPIGEASGDIICIGIQENNFGKIFYSYHEDEGNKKYYLVAKSFNEFILSFKKKVENSINLDEVEIELDDELWNE